MYKKHVNYKETDENNESWFMNINIELYALRLR